MNTRPSRVNITPAERLGRVVVGLTALMAAALFIRGAASGWVVALDMLLALAGLDLVITGATGHCPLYQWLGHVPASMKGSPS